MFWTYIVSLVVFVLSMVVSAAASTKPTYADLTTATAAVADMYVAAYASLDWDRLEPLLGDTVSHRYPAAKQLFGSPGASGKTTLMKQFRQNQGVITKMSFHRRRSIYSGSYGIYDGDLTFVLRLENRLQIESTPPIVLTIRMEDGKVVEHRDYVDHTKGHGQ